MKIVTSLGPNRIERQQLCLRSWISAGHEVVAIQSVGETEKFSPHFPQATFVETDLVGDLFGKPTFVRIKAMTDQAVDGNVLIVNSDIELVGDHANFLSQWSEPQPKVLKMGVRWDVSPKNSRIRTMFKWGVDAFLITPQIAADLPDVGLAIGCPAWDYWIPYHLHTLGYTFVTNKEFYLAHTSHDRAWSNSDYETGLRIMKQHYGIERTPLAHFVQEITGRKSLKNVRRVRR